MTSLSGIKVLRSISGYGQNGPSRDEPAMGMILQASSGLMSVTRNGRRKTRTLRLLRRFLTVEEKPKVLVFDTKTSELIHTIADPKAALCGTRDCCSS